MNSARSSILSVEDRMIFDVGESAENSYPDDWPLPSNPLSDSKKSLEHNGEDGNPATGIRTPPPQQQEQHERIPSLDSQASRLRRSSSVASSNSPQRKRLSLNFPVQPAPRLVQSAFASPRTPTSPVDISQISHADSAAFLTALAAQERRVLELREDLAKAETELKNLKRQWAIHEATRKRHELLQTEVRGGTDGEIGDGQRITSSTLSEEQQARRRAAMAKLTQASTRSVTSQRHHRTLSLLSPQRTTYSQPFPQPSDVRDGDDAESIASFSARVQARRSETLPTSTGRPLSMIETGSFKRDSQDVLLRTGKQMADGFRESLWAFMEDLRQAAVGDVDSTPRAGSTSRSNSSLGAPAQNLRRQSSKNSIRSVSSTGTNSKLPRAKSPALTNVTPETDTNNSWHRSEESPHLPSARWSSSTTFSSDQPGSTNTSVTHSRSSTPRTSTSSVQSSTISTTATATTSPQVMGGPLQLPLWGSVMSVSTQFNLKKTATMVLSQVEKTLAVVAGDDQGGNGLAYGASPTTPTSASTTSSVRERREREREREREKGRENGAGKELTKGVGKGTGKAEIEGLRLRTTAATTSSSSERIVNRSKN